MKKTRIVGKVVLLFGLPVSLVIFLVNGFIIPRMGLEQETSTVLSTVILYVGIAVSSFGCALWANKLTYKDWWANRSAQDEEEKTPGETEDS